MKSGQSRATNSGKFFNSRCNRTVVVNLDPRTDTDPFVAKSIKMMTNLVKFAIGLVVVELSCVTVKFDSNTLNVQTIKWLSLLGAIMRGMQGILSSLNHDPCRVHLPPGAKRVQSDGWHRAAALSKVSSSRMLSSEFHTHQVKLHPE